MLATEGVRKVPIEADSPPPIYQKPHNMPMTAPKQRASWLPAQSSLHFIAGGLGGMCGAIITAPFDTVKTRLQSSMFNKGPTAVSVKPGSPALLWNFVETGHILRDIARDEGFTALFKGLGPTLVGVIPARSINFFTYGNGKQIIANQFNEGRENAFVHLSAAAIAGIITGSATNPIWVVKTRMQLSASQAQPFTSSLACITHILRNEGIAGMYKGLSASYLGVTEGVIQWTLYEQLKRLTKRAEGGPLEWAGMLGAAGSAKMIASLITYPHEVIRTRLRQPVVNGVQKYKGLYQTFRLVLAEEGARSLYGGLSAHLLRVIPNAAVMYGVYEAILRFGK